ncbi:MAG: transposase [Candidatus Omnitrophota bacterium]
MPRTARIVAIGLPHHITHRGNNKNITFFDNEDYQKYLFFLENYKNKYDLEIFTYSLMPNHIHFKVIPNKADSLAKVFNYTQMCYAQHFNKKYKKIGHLWQSRFFSCPLDKQHAYAVTKYIELNPVTARLVEKPEQWKWSSATDHLNTGKGLISLSPMKKIMEIQNWQEYLQQGVSTEMIERIDSHSLSGKPLGNKKFINFLAKKCGIFINSRPKGRPLIK